MPKGSRITGTPPIAVKVDDSNPGYTIFSFQVTTEFLGSSRVFFDYLSPVPKESTDSTAKFYHQSGLTNYSFTAQ